MSVQTIVRILDSCGGWKHIRRPRLREQAFQLIYSAPSEDRNRQLGMSSWVDGSCRAGRIQGIAVSLPRRYGSNGARGGTLITSLFNSPIKLENGYISLSNTITVLSHTFCPLPKSKMSMKVLLLVVAALAGNVSAQGAAWAQCKYAHPK